jgi:hypothetical protein
VLARLHLLHDVTGLRTHQEALTDCSGSSPLQTP